MKILLLLLAALTSIACTVLLLRAYLATRRPILLWSSLCFVGQSVNNIALFVDLVILPDIDLRLIRLGAALIGMVFLLFGFIRESH